MTIVPVGWILRLFLADAGALPASSQLPLFAILAVLELAVPRWAERARATNWHPHHIAERYGLFGLSGQNHRVKKPEADPVVARNRKAAHDYHLGESWEAGIVLQGAEVKALRAGRASLVGGFAAVEDREIWLHGVHIPQYSQARWFNDGSRRKRKLLLHRAQIDKIERKVNESGLTIVPVTLYFKDGRAKVEIALARGKKTWDKRHALAEREASREAERAVSRRLKGRPD